MIDPNSDTWRDIEKWARAELDLQMKVLKDASASHDATQVARGEVKRLEALLALPYPKAKPKIEAGLSYEA